MSNKAIRQPTRREEYAEATRLAIVDAARKLFSEHGFFGTKVEDIATLARVSPATIYAVTGGKHGLLRRLIDMGQTIPMVDKTLAAIRSADDPVAVIAMTARYVREMREDFGDILRVMTQAAPHDEDVAESCRRALAGYRETLAVSAARLTALGALKSGLGEQEALDILWFYFGSAGLETLVQENRWCYDRAESWLVEQARCSLLKPQQGQHAR
jgi:AcrR family transcriptional regulator